MLLHTMTPSSDEIAICCKRLVEKHEVLKDTEGSGYVISYHYLCVIIDEIIQDSWKQKLSMKFRNLRRPERSDGVGLKESASQLFLETEQQPSSSQMEVIKIIPCIILS